MNYFEADGIVWLRKNTQQQSNMSNSVETKSEEPKKIQNDYLQNSDKELTNSEISDNESVNEIVLNDENVWDDSLLIKMYENSQKVIKDALLNKPSTSTTSDSKDSKNQTKKRNNKSKQKSKQKTQSNKQQTVWNIKDYCRVKYSEDQIEYEAQIIEIDNSNGQVLISFLGYENEEWHSIDDIKPSAGPQIRAKQIMEIENQQQQQEQQPSSSSLPLNSQILQDSDYRPIPPPVPFINQSSISEEDSLASMLMSWYMTGYHTGYYQAVKQFKKK